MGSMQVLIESIVTFQAKRVGDGFRSEPRDGVHVELLPGRSPGDWDLYIYDEEYADDVIGDPAQVTSLYGKTIDAVLGTARVYVTQYLKKHPKGWAAADQEQKFNRLSRGR